MDMYPHYFIVLLMIVIAYNFRKYRRFLKCYADQVTEEDTSDRYMLYVREQMDLWAFTMHLQTQGYVVYIYDGCMPFVYFNAEHKIAMVKWVKEKHVNMHSDLVMGGIEIDIITAYQITSHKEYKELQHKTA